MEETLYPKKLGRFYFYPYRKIKLFERIFNFIKYKDKRCLFENCIPLLRVKELVSGCTGIINPDTQQEQTIDEFVAYFNKN